MPKQLKHRPTTDWVVFGVTAVLTGAFIVWGFVNTESLKNVSANALSVVMEQGGWAFVLAASGFVVFALWIAFSRYGRITLGKEGEEPEFRTVSWVAMMFSAGMGIGLMFFGVADPIKYFETPPPGTSPADAAETMEVSLATTLFHWTLHPWSIYAVVGLAIAYSCFRRGRRQTISATFIPLIGERRAYGGLGKVIDILAIFATLFGSAASLGLGALQISAGVQAVGWSDAALGEGMMLVIIGILTAAFVLSAVSGVERGIQWLSNINMVLAGLLVVFVFSVGPSIYMLDIIPTSVSAYFENMFQMAGRTNATGGSVVAEWLAGNSVFYWAWWISWTPFVGMFIARISRGRTIRQFVGGVILVPSVVSLIWFVVFGGTAMERLINGAVFTGTDPVTGLEFTSDNQLYAVLREYPWFTATSLIVMILVAIFFVSGADAASIVMGTLSQKGTLEPSKPVVIVWGVATGAVAGIMLLIGGGGKTALTGLQNLTILAAVPFTAVMIVLCIALTKDLREDRLIVRAEQGSEAVSTAVDEAHDRYDGEFAFKIGPADDDHREDGEDEDREDVETVSAGTEKAE